MMPLYSDSPIRGEARTTLSPIVSEIPTHDLSEAQVRTIHATITDLWDKRGYRDTRARIAR